MLLQGASLANMAPKSDVFGFQKLAFGLLFATFWTLWAACGLTLGTLTRAQGRKHGV